MKPPIPSLVAAVFIAAFSQASAVTVAFYDFEAGLNGREQSDDTDLTSTASSFTLSGADAVGTSPQAAISTSTHQPYIRTLSLTDSKAGAIANNDYFTFTLTPDVGVPYSLTQLALDFGGSNISSGSSPADDYTAYLSLQVRVGAGSFFDVGSEISKLVPYNGSSGSQLSPRSVDLSGVAALQNVTEAVTFRMYLYSSVSNDSKIVRMDNVTLSAIPEPSAAALGLLGVAGLAFRRRRTA